MINAVISFPITLLLSLFSPSVPIRAEKCLQLKTIVWWRQKCLTGFFCCENGIFNPTKKCTVDQYINISRFLIQLEWTSQSSRRALSSKGHFSHPDPDVPRLSSASVNPTTLCPPRTFLVAPYGFPCTGWVRSFVWSEQVLEQLKLGKGSLEKHLLTCRTSERNHREEKKRSEKLLDCSNPPDTPHNLLQGGKGNRGKA